jgi:hypothetical protein
MAMILSEGLFSSNGQPINPDRRAGDRTAKLQIVPDF